MITPELVDAYRWRRRVQPTNWADLSLAEARADVANGRKRYPSPPLDAARLTRAPSAVAPYPAAKRQPVFYDTPEQCGFRLVGFADEILNDYFGPYGRLGHNGWYSDAHQDSTYRGAVLQLPGRKGESRFVAAYQESDNDGYLVDLSEVYTEPRGDYASASDLDAAREAARAGDQLAERNAEKSREYDEAWQAGREWADLGEEIADARKSALAILAERRDVKELERKTPALCDAFRARVESLLEEIRTARDKRTELEESVWRDYYAAFNEGAGAAVFAS